MKHHSSQQAKGTNTAQRLLCEALLRFESPDQVQALLQDLCTPAELEAIVDRWRVALMLKQGMTYREINQRTGVSVTTVGRVARFIDMGAGGYQAALDRIELPEVLCG